MEVACHVRETIRRVGSGCSVADMCGDVLLRALSKIATVTHHRLHHCLATPCSLLLCVVARGLDIPLASRGIAAAIGEVGIVGR